MSEHSTIKYEAVFPDTDAIPLYIRQRIKRRRRRFQAVSDLRAVLCFYLEHRRGQLTTEEAVQWVRLLFDLLMFPSLPAEGPDGHKWGIRRIREPTGW